MQGGQSTLHKDGKFAYEFEGCEEAYHANLDKTQWESKKLKGNTLYREKLAY